MDMSTDKESTDKVTNQCDNQSDNCELFGTVDHETQVCEGEEADLHEHYKGCKKNPGHKEFIPIETFSIKHLPECMRDNDLYEFIKITADLTVTVDVRMTSPYRPAVEPNTKSPYPFYNIRNSRKMRVGSGMIRLVHKYVDGVEIVGERNGSNHWRDCQRCWCRRCQASDSPSNVWWEFGVVTATHVVLDNLEANFTTLRLFYDKEDSPAVSLDAVLNTYASIENDSCRLNSVTCDEIVGSKMMKLWERYNVIWKTVCDRYHKSEDLTRLTFIVSHPHGCSKQVSVGRWQHLNREILKCAAKFSYTTCTCPGSSGAQVHCVGYRTAGWWSDIVHKGSLKSGLNQSGIGYVC